jgi:hypothetical protein
MEGKQTEDDVVLIVEQSLGSSGTRLFNLGSEAKESLDTSERTHPHAEVNNHEIRVGAEVDRSPVNMWRHGTPCMLHDRRRR